MNRGSQMGGRGGQKGGPGGSTKAPEKPKNIKRTLGRLLSYMGSYKWMLFAAIFCTMISSLASVAGTYFLKPILNTLDGLAGTGEADLSGLIKTLVTMGAIYLIGVSCNFIGQRLLLNVSTGSLLRIRKDMFKKMQDLPLRYFDSRTHGEIMSLYTNDTDTLREFIGQGVPQGISSFITVIGVFIMMIILSWRLTLLVLVMLVIMFFVIKTIGGRSGGYFKRQQQELSKVNGYIEEMMEGQKVVKVFSHEDKSKEEFEELNERLRSASCSANTLSNILMPIMGNLSYIHYALTAGIGALLAINGVMDIGTIASFLQYTRSFSQPLTMISQYFNTFLMAIAGAERVFALIDEEPEEDNGYVKLVNAKFGGDGQLTECDERTGIWAWKHPHGDGTLTYTEVKGSITFDDVHFGYTPDKPVLKGITLYAKPGQKIAFVGSTGAGKTTITNLINRFYDVPDGKIRYDGININKIKKDDLRRSLAFVLQDTHLFTGTVMENIRYGKLDASDEEIYQAAKLSNADFFISHLPEGYNTMLTSDGANLSQGQRQLLAISRAAVADPPVLVLDEATSSIDTRTEWLIEKGMDTLMENRTVFVIAHRLSTVRNSNAIMVLENGEIIERGDHADLIDLKGKYYSLYMGMFELT